MRDHKRPHLLRTVLGGLACALALSSTACQMGISRGPATPTAVVPTPTTPPNATDCSQVYGFAGAPPLDVPGFQLPPGTVGVQRTKASGDNRLTVLEYAVCVSVSNLGVAGGTLGVIYGGNWQYARTFPADGRAFTPCQASTPATPTSIPTPTRQPTPQTPSSTSSATATSQPTVQMVQPACAQLPTLIFAMADQGIIEGQGLLVFRLRLASPPHPCGASFFPSVPGQGYPPDVAPLVGYDETRVPLPPLSLTGQSRVSFQAADGTATPYALVAVCTQGTSQSILSDLRRLLAGYGWAAENTQGTQWVTTTQGGGRLHARFDGLGTPQDWTLTLAANLNETPAFPTPVPTGPDASCSSVPGLGRATPLRLPNPGVSFPGDTVAVVANTTRGSVYTIVDYFGCAPHFELTSNPAFGSAGYPLYAVFDQQEWNYAANFPFDGTNLQSCDFTAVGNYLRQFCRSNGTIDVEIERVDEPGKGLVTFHLLYARKN